jgi:hypothetical protein
MAYALAARHEQTKSELTVDAKFLSTRLASLARVDRHPVPIWFR